MRLDAGEMAEPFITLSSSSPSSVEEHESPNTSPEDSFDEATPISRPPPATHDTRRAEFHIKDLDAFAKNLQNAADRAFPNEGRAETRYSNVSVLLLRWEDDEMNVEWELDDLEKVFGNYGFETERWLIPTRSSHLKLMSKVVDVVEEHDGDGGLVIVYYAGHAGINASRGATWTCKMDPCYASLEWSAIQTLFEKADFDVLLLLDCCAAASAAPTAGSAVTETIAACGFESIAPQPGRYSFTNSLIEVLEDWIDSPPFSAAMLHNKVLSILKHERPERMQNGKRRKLECRRTPIHMVATANPTLASIELGRRMILKPPVRNSTSLPTAIRSIQTPPPGPELPNQASVIPEPLSPRWKGYQAESINDLEEDEYEVPRVIISLALEKHQKLNSESCQKWLTSCPALVKYAKVEAVYNSFSALVLLSIPVFIWNLLPEDPACSFVGYITSPNMFEMDPASSLTRVMQAPFSSRIETPVESDLLLRQLYSSCHRCCGKEIECTGAGVGSGGCKSCAVSRSECVYGPIGRKEAASTGYVDGPRESLELVEFSLKLRKLRENILDMIPGKPKGTIYPPIAPSHIYLTPESRTNDSEPATRSEFQSSVHSGYKANAMDYDVSLLHKLNAQRETSTKTHLTNYSRPELAFPGETCYAEHRSSPDAKLLSGSSSVQDCHEKYHNSLPTTKISAYQAQEDEFVRQQILKQDPIIKEEKESFFPSPLQTPCYIPSSDEHSWDHNTRAWIAPKPEFPGTSTTPLLSQENVSVKTEISNDVKIWTPPPEKRRKLLPSVETCFTGAQTEGANPSFSPFIQPILDPHAANDSISSPGSLHNRFRGQTRTPQLMDGSESLFSSQESRHEDGTKRSQRFRSKTPSEATTPSTFYRGNANTQLGPPSITYNFRMTPERQIRQSSPLGTSQPPPIIVSRSSALRTTPVNQDWTFITDIAERRRIQNRIAQRNYSKIGKRLKRRLEDLERAGSSTMQPSVPTADYQQYALPRLDHDQMAPIGATSPIERIMGNLKPFRFGLGDTLGRYLPEGGIIDAGLDEDLSISGTQSDRVTRVESLGQSNGAHFNGSR